MICIDGDDEGVWRGSEELKEWGNKRLVTDCVVFSVYELLCSCTKYYLLLLSFSSNLFHSEHDGDSNVQTPCSFPFSARNLLISDHRVYASDLRRSGDRCWPASFVCGVSVAIFTVSNVCHLWSCQIDQPNFKEILVSKADQRPW